MSIRAFVTGASGTGKSALVRGLHTIGVHALDMDVIPGLARWENRETGEASKWSPNAGPEWHGANDWIISDPHLRELLRDPLLRVVAGLAANQSDFADLFDVSILLRCTEETFLQRIFDRTDNRYGKECSEQQRILETYKEMESEMLDLGAIPIDTERNISLVVKDITELIEG